ncbi:MAG: undecaprenyl-diphosphate phosphatase [Bacteroidales bacterium]|nr:undecaprenyl-diphosphate phosphatase [Bacteroidales bacterium]
MSYLQAIILGIIQGLTEFLPVSSSGHLVIAENLFGLHDGAENLSFTVVLHIATVLSTLLALRTEVFNLCKGVCKFQWNDEMEYAWKIIISMIPIFIVGIFFKDTVENIFGSGLLIVGICLYVTAALLFFAYKAKPRNKEDIGWLDAFIIGIAQAIAVLPGLSRSGSTIATGLILGNEKESVAKFSFLMVIIPILGEAILDCKELLTLGGSDSQWGVITAGFLTAFLVGYMACKWMINIVKKGKLIYFAIYCALAATLSIILYCL